MIRGKILFFGGMLAALGAGWIGFPYVIYETRPQALDFSHKAHAEKAGMKCEDCHAFREDGTFAGHSSPGTVRGLPRRAHGDERGGKEVH